VAFVVEVMIADRLEKAVHSQSRRDFARIVPAHAISDYAKLQALVNREAVFVGGSNSALIADAVCPEHHHTYRRSPPTEQVRNRGRFSTARKSEN
jgi:hypothetical protein